MSDTVQVYLGELKPNTVDALNKSLPALDKKNTVVGKVTHDALAARVAKAEAEIGAHNGEMRAVIEQIEATNLAATSNGAWAKVAITDNAYAAKITEIGKAAGAAINIYLDEEDHTPEVGDWIDIFGLTGDGEDLHGTYQIATVPTANHVTIASSDPLEVDSIFNEGYIATRRVAVASTTGLSSGLTMTLLTDDAKHASTGVVTIISPTLIDLGQHVPETWRIVDDADGIASAGSILAADSPAMHAAAGKMRWAEGETKSLDKALGIVIRNRLFGEALGLKRGNTWEENEKSFAAIEWLAHDLGGATIELPPYEFIMRHSLTIFQSHRTVWKAGDSVLKAWYGDGGFAGDGTPITFTTAAQVATRPVSGAVQPIVVDDITVFRLYDGIWALMDNGQYYYGIIQQIIGTTGIGQIVCSGRLDVDRSIPFGSPIGFSRVDQALINFGNQAAEDLDDPINNCLWERGGLDGNWAHNNRGRANGIAFNYSATGIIVDRTVAFDMPANETEPNKWGNGGDGYVIGGAGGQVSDITLDQVQGKNCWRGNVSVINGSNIELINGKSFGSQGDKPGFDIDIEADPGLGNAGVSIRGWEFYDANVGLLITATARGVTGSDLHFKGSRTEAMSLQGKQITLKNIWIDLDAGNAVRCDGCSGVTLDGVQIYGSYDSDEREAFIIKNCEGVRLENVDVVGTYATVLNVDAASDGVTGGVNGLTLENFKTQNCVARVVGGYVLPEENGVEIGSQDFVPVMLFQSDGTGLKTIRNVSMENVVISDTRPDGNEPTVPNQRATYGMRAVGVTAAEFMTWSYDGRNNLVSANISAGNRWSGFPSDPCIRTIASYDITVIWSGTPAAHQYLASGPVPASSSLEVTVSVPEARIGDVVEFAIKGNTAGSWDGVTELGRTRVVNDTGVDNVKLKLNNHSHADRTPPGPLPLRVKVHQFVSPPE